MKNTWAKFRDKPRDRVDGFVFEIAKASLSGTSNLLGLAEELLPNLTDEEVAALVHLNLDLVRPPHENVGWAAWVRGWEDGIYFGLRACGASAIDPLKNRVAMKRRDTARSMYFECLISAMLTTNANGSDFEALVTQLEPLDYLDLFETADVSTWVSSIVKFDECAPDEPHTCTGPLLEWLEKSWFSDPNIRDRHDQEHSCYPWASAVLHIALHMPNLRSRYLKLLCSVADGTYFPVPIDVHRADDSPFEGVSRVLKIGCMQGAALVLLEEDPSRQDLIALCRAYADSPAADTREAWKQWLPIAERQLPRAFAVLS